jgi:hypothetical protein
MLSQSHPPSAQPRRSTTHPSEDPSLPEYVAPEAPLTADAQRHLGALISNYHHRNLITHLKHAAEKLTHSGGEVNERLADARGRYDGVRDSMRTIKMKKMMRMMRSISGLRRRRLESMPLQRGWRRRQD